MPLLPPRAGALPIGAPPLTPTADDRRCGTADHPGVECLRWMGFKIACGLAPDDPALLWRHQMAIEQLVRMGVLASIPAHEQALRLLYSAAHDTLLPWHWRRACLDQLNRPLAALHRLVADANAPVDPDARAALAARLQRFQWCLSQRPLKES